jgi:IS30 family transposase
MTYRQITSAERYIISDLRMKGMNKSQIATALGRHRSTIGRELKRNSAPYDGRYRPSVAIQHASGRRSRSRRNLRFTAGECRLVETLLREKWSPEQISGRARLLGLLSICHQTIYRHVGLDKRRGGNLYLHLRHAGKKRRKSYGGYDYRGRLAGKRHISERPNRAGARARIGDWEIDTVVGAGDKHCIVTLVERKSKVTLIGKLKARTTVQANARIKKLFKRHPGAFTSFTADNGTEFHDYKTIERKTGIAFYFATPYHSWERGLNENTNGLIRQYLPKRASMAALTQRDCNAIANQLNDRPRKRLGYRTPREVFNEEQPGVLQFKG